MCVLSFSQRNLTKLHIFKLLPIEERQEIIINTKKGANYSLRQKHIGNLYSDNATINICAIITFPQTPFIILLLQNYTSIIQRQKHLFVAQKYFIRKESLHTFILNI